MNRLTKVTAFLAALLMAAGASADPVTFGPAGSAPLQVAFDGMTFGGPSSVDVETDQEAYDATWTLTTAEASSLLVMENAGFANKNEFGLYDLVTGEMVPIFLGSDGPGVTMLIAFVDNLDGTYSIWTGTSSGLSDTLVDFTSDEFGYYLDSSANVGGGVWYSQSFLNSDGTDHLKTYRGQNDCISDDGTEPCQVWTPSEYLLAWEDLDLNSADLGAPAYNGDFNDMLVLVEGVIPVPAPGTLALFGLGLIGLGLSRRRKA